VSDALHTPYRGGFVGPEHRFAFTVYFEDTDTAGVVYYANYLKFMERARSDMIRAVGVDQRAALSDNGSAYFVTEVNIRYLRPAKLGDDLLVVSTVEAVRAASVDIHQRVMRGEEQLTDARVTAAFLDAQGRPQRQPREWVDRFKAIMDGSHTA
jgi:acyl-CoA thioester hydrolase